VIDGHAGDLDQAPATESAIGHTPHLLFKNQAGTSPMGDGNTDIQQVIESGTPDIVQVYRAYDEPKIVLIARGLLFITTLPQPLSAGTLHKLEVGGMIDHAQGIGVLVINPNPI